MKRSFQKIPAPILNQITACAGKPFVVFALVELRPGEDFPNLPGVLNDGDDSRFPAQVLPDPSSGPWARRNVEGWEIVRRDWPMTTQTFSHESPNFGDWSRGSHEVSFTRDVYQREYFPGYATPITVSVERRVDDRLTLLLELDRVFGSMPDDDREFLFALNVFQESVGQSAVRATDQPASSFLRSLRVDWELLPVGEREEALQQVRRRLKPTPAEDKILTERMDLLYRLRPEALITGTSHFARYVGGKFRDDLVMFDNIRYGNAAYIMFEDWETISKLSRTELLASDHRFERIVHRLGWERTVRAIVSEYRHRGKQ